MRTFARFAALLLSIAVSVAAADAFRWDDIPHADRLDATQRELATTLFDSTQCYYGCSGSVSHCLARQPPSAAATRIAALIVRRVLGGASFDDVGYVVANRKRSAFPDEIRTISVDALTPLGSPGAPVEVVLYVDYECSVCERSFAAMDKIVAEMPRDVVVYVKCFPLSSHPFSVDEASAALAADNQGKYWEMTRMLFAERDGMDDQRLRDFATRLDLDLDAFDRDRRDPATRARVAADKAEAVAFGVTSSPGIFINGKFYRSGKNYVDLEDRIEEELEILALSSHPSAH